MSKTHKWTFFGEVPLLYEARNVVRQLEVEMWLDPSPLLGALNLKPMCQERPCKPKYVA